MITLSPELHDAYRTDGSFRLPGFVDAAVGEAMLARVVELCRAAAAGDDIRPAFVMPESQFLTDTATDGRGWRPVPESDATGNTIEPEDLASKVFRLHRDPVFHEFATSIAVVELVRDVLDTDDVSCFLSQFIFKNPGAWGQPWHQDSYYFPFEPARPVVGIWLAVTQATLANGCLWVLPGSHTEPVHEHVRDARPGANYGYVEIVDHDMAAASPVLMEPGDLLVFDSHLMHRSTDNGSEGIRAAMVFHYAATGTVDHTEAVRGYTINDWMPVPA